MQNYKSKLKNINFKMVVAIFLFFVFFSFFPAISQAALVPCGRSDQGGTMCTLCDLIIGIKGLIDYGFTIMVVVALMMIVISGVVYIVSAGNTGMMETAKHLLKNVLVGFFLILGAWLIVNTTMLVIGAKGDLGIGITNWYTFTCNK